MSEKSNALGRRGETLAAAYYEKAGYRILAMNYRTRRGEIDCIAQKDALVVFAEVKSRSAGAIAAPREWVDVRKQRRIIAAAQEYLQKEFLAEPFVRFDVVEVLINEEGASEICCLENAFEL